MLSFPNVIVQKSQTRVNVWAAKQAPESYLIWAKYQYTHPSICLVGAATFQILQEDLKNLKSGKSHYLVEVTEVYFYVISDRRPLSCSIATKESSHVAHS